MLRPIKAHVPNFPRRHTAAAIEIGDHVAGRELYRRRWAEGWTAKATALAAEARPGEALPVSHREIGRTPTLAARAPDLDLEAVSQDLAERAERQRRASR